MSGDVRESIATISGGVFETSDEKPKLEAYQVPDENRLVLLTSSG
jgi:hypothetical protein